MKTTARPAAVDAFEIGSFVIPPGSRLSVDLPFSLLSNHTPMTLPVHVVHGTRPGPVLFISAAVHGDEVLGVEIIRRILRRPALKRLRGTLLAIPIVNAYGFISHSRYLPDRRDLNRSFPGSGGGSLAAQLADLFLREIVQRSDVGIDLHSASANRTNLPQVRVSDYEGRLRELADAFGAPLIMEANLREGSLRAAAREHGVDMLLYEGGEALRFDEFAIRVGERGILSVMRTLGMVAEKAGPAPRRLPVLSRKSSWVRAPAGGLFRAYRPSGAAVGDDDILGVISDPFGEKEVEVTAGMSGIIIGRTNLPVINQGDALFHIARVAKPDEAENTIGAISGEIDSHTMFDEDEII